MLHEKVNMWCYSNDACGRLGRISFCVNETTIAYNSQKSGYLAKCWIDEEIFIFFLNILRERISVIIIWCLSKYFHNVQTAIFWAKVNTIVHVCTGKELRYYKIDNQD